MQITRSLTNNALGQRSETDYTTDGLVAATRTPPVPGLGALQTRYGFDHAGNPTHVYSPAASAGLEPPVVNEF
ncbi:MAG: hypothetical protein ACRD0U_07045 [Acidimicrobiales bacterium]